MNAFLDKPSRRWMIFAFSIIVFVSVSVSSVYAWYADHLAESSEPNNWMRAAQLEPGNADYWYKLGFNRQWDLNDADSGQVINYLRRAVSIDPRSADYWMALAGAYESAGQLPQARDAFHTALTDYPASAEAHWRFGSFLLRQGETQNAYSEIHYALQNDPRLIPLAISRVWPATHDADALLNDVLPSTIQAQNQALEAFSDDHNFEAALAVWKHMVSGGQSIPITDVFALENILIEADRGEYAREVWRQALIASGNPGEAQTGDSVVFNGGFEYDASGGGLDWHLVPIPGVNYDYDSSNPHSGKRALKLAFDGEQNPGFETVYQHVMVRPNTRYHFEAYIRTAGMTTESGVHFLISPEGTTQPKIILDNVSGDHAWEKQSADFTTGPDVHRLILELYRIKSVRFDNKLSGAAWVDDISIVPVGSSQPIR
jgi:tetratricopeptide (TPR) repeat protein